MARYDYKFEDDGTVIEVQHPIDQPALTEIDGRPVRRLIAKSVGFNWVGGGGYGRKRFHACTNGEVARDSMERGKRIGADLEPMPVRAELI